TSTALTAHSSFAGITNPSFLFPHPNGEWLYAVSETGQHDDGKPGEVWALRLYPDQDKIEPLNHQPSGGDFPCHLAIDATGRWLLVSNYGSGTVGVLPILEDGALGALSDLVQHHGTGPNAERQEGPHVHSVTFTPDQRFAIVADLGIDALVLYTLDPQSGKLHEHTRVTTRPGAGPRHAAFHPDGEHLYVANELDNTVAVYRYDAGNGTLQEQQIIPTLPPDTPSSIVAESTVADIHLSPTADRVYVSNRGRDSIAIFAVAADRHLSALAYVSSGGHYPRNFAVTSDGRSLLVANQLSNELVVVPTQYEQAGTPLTKISVPGASCVRF
ncbi:MAG TPA: lactonase family protein, partial [Ktedonobacteraceae bacterium]|nr:lactonase family protein [Ktedonobacteraceae bacterium]